ncbi:uncharacterized protein LOC135821132 isoform X2 [Sycon ciliatum]
MRLLLSAVLGLFLVCGTVNAAGDYNYTCDGVTIIVATQERLSVQATLFCQNHGLEMITFNNVHAFKENGDHCLSQSIVKSLSKDSVHTLWVRRYGRYFANTYFDLKQDTVYKGNYTQALPTVCVPQSLDRCLTSTCPEGTVCRTPKLDTHVCLPTKWQTNITQSVHGRGVHTEVVYEYMDDSNLYLASASEVLRGCPSDPAYTNAGPFNMALYLTYPAVRSVVKQMLLVAGTNRVTTFVRNPDEQHTEYRTFYFDKTKGAWTNKVNYDAKVGVAICTRERRFDHIDISGIHCQGQKYHVGIKAWPRWRAEADCESADLRVMSFNQVAQMKNDSCFQEKVLAVFKTDGRYKIWVTDYNILDQKFAYSLDINTGLDSITLQGEDAHNVYICTSNWEDKCAAGKELCGSGEICRIDATGVARCHVTSVQEEGVVMKNGKKRTEIVWFHAFHGWMYHDTPKATLAACDRQPSPLLGVYGVFNSVLYHHNPRFMMAFGKLLHMTGVSQVSILTHGHQGKSYDTFTYSRKTGNWTFSGSDATTGLVICSTQVLREFIPDSSHTCGGEDFFVSADHYGFYSAHNLCKKHGKDMLTFNSMRVLNKDNSCFRNTILKTLRNKGHDDFWISQVGIYDNHEAYNPQTDTVQYDGEGGHAVICSRPQLDSCWAHGRTQPCGNEKLCRSISLTGHVCHDTRVGVQITKEEGGQTRNYTVHYELGSGTILYEDPAQAKQSCGFPTRFAYSFPFRMEEYTAFSTVNAAVNTLFGAIDVGVTLFVTSVVPTPPLNGEFRTFRYTPRLTTNWLAKPAPDKGVVICSTIYPHRRGT